MTNEELCAIIRDGDNDERHQSTFTLWEQTHKWFYAIARKLYSRHAERAASCGVVVDDCLQVCWFAFADAVRD
jgi:hypothetical protein